MAVDWTGYDGFDWAGASQAPMSAVERDVVVELVANLLALDASDRDREWGAASAPGRFAATVICVHPGVQHRYLSEMRAAGVGQIGVKVLKANADAAREAERAESFHRRDLPRLPGLPNERVQRSLDAGIRADRDGRRRGFVVLEWMVGETLEDLLRRGELTGAGARGVLVQLLGDIVIPLWAAGTVWWDFRDANVIRDTATGRVRLIDVDSLAAYADEILRTPDHWEKRDKGRATALARLRRMAVRLVQATAAGARKKIETAVTEAWQHELEVPFTALGKAADSRSLAVAALARFLARLESRGLLPGTDDRTDTTVEGDR